MSAAPAPEASLAGTDIDTPSSSAFHVLPSPGSTASPLDCLLAQVAEMQANHNLEMESLASTAAADQENLQLRCGMHEAVRASTIVYGSGGYS